MGGRISKKVETRSDASDGSSNIDPGFLLPAFLSSQNETDIRFDRKWDAARKEVEATKKSLDGVRREIKKLKDEFASEQNNIRKELQEELQLSQIRVIEVIGIFVALVTFVSVNVQIFNRVSSAETAAVFMVLMFCALAVFAVLLDILLVPRNGGFPWSRWAALFLLLFLAGGSIVYSNNVSLNPVSDSLEFSRAVEKRIRDEVAIQVASSTFSKDEINVMAISHQKFVECIRTSKSLWPCVQ